MAMLPYSCSNNDFSFAINNFSSYEFEELQQQQPQYQHRSSIPNSHVHASNIINSHSLATLLEKQEHETYELVKIQNDQMKFVLQQQRELQMAAVRSMEIYLQQILTEKDEEIIKGAKKKQDLENILRSLETEKIKLKRVAEEKVAMAIYLHNKLEEEKKRVRMLLENNDVESCCAENKEARSEKCVRHESNMMSCPMCNTNSPGVLYLPCRHISSCKVCEVSVKACLICRIAKNGAIETQSFTSDKY